MAKRLVSMMVFLGLLSGLILAACAPAAAPATPTPAPAAKAPAASPTAAPPPPTATATPRKLEKVVLAIPAVGLSDLFTVVAEKKGFYKEEGFEVDKQVIGSDIAVKAVIAGEIEYTRAIGSVLRAATQGLAVKGILAAQTRPPQLLVSRPEFKTVQELKGKTIGIDSQQGTTHVLLKAIVKYYGMDPEKDIVAVALTDNPTRLKAVQGGAVQAAMLDLAIAIKAESEGLRILANAGDITERIMGGLATSDKRIKENPDQVLRFVRAHVKALKYIKDAKNRDDIIKIMMDELKLTLQESTKTYDIGIKGFSDDGDISEAVVKLDIDDAKTLAKITNEVPVSQAFDYSFVRKLKQ